LSELKSCKNILIIEIKKGLSHLKAFILDRKRLLKKKRFKRSKGQILMWEFSTGWGREEYQRVNINSGMPYLKQKSQSLYLEENEFSNPPLL
jgi:hypothetical protein